MFIDTAAGGSLLKKGSSEAMEIIESMATTSYQWLSERVQLKKIVVASSSDPMALILTQLAEMNSRIAALTLGNPEPAVEIPTGIEDANYINDRNYGNFQHRQQGGYNSGQQFHHGGRRQPNLAYENLNNAIQPPPGFSVTNGVINEEKKPNIEELLMKFMSKSDERMEKLESNAAAVGTQMKMIVDLPSGTTQEGPKTTKYESAPPFEEKAEERHKKERMKERLYKFLEIFKKVNINVPLVEMLLEMPHNAKFLKNIVSRKKKLGEFKTVRLNEECSAILQRKLPAKVNDPGSLTLSCIIGGQHFGRSLCDLGASINLMPLSVFKQLAIVELKPTSMRLQMDPGDQKFKGGDLDGHHGAGSSWSQHCLYQPP
ncbi:uncharacterized protein LOC131018952 [Salvia miltiorrhiza]|uniref:uncharacterized protein LOC131018952 n=1 Tax=Salvia miltiorrhiza TaxID=226208 RepID=UPI0025ACD11B|nr:uncharacterized protein LOC131018952 [Salvia miltiorrhiza]